MYYKSYIDLKRIFYKSFNAYIKLFKISKNLWIYFTIYEAIIVYAYVTQKF